MSLQVSESISYFHGGSDAIVPLKTKIRMHLIKMFIWYILWHLVHLKGVTADRYRSSWQDEAVIPWVSKRSTLIHAHKNILHKYSAKHKDTLQKCIAKMHCKKTQFRCCVLVIIQQNFWSYLVYNGWHSTQISNIQRITWNCHKFSCPLTYIKHILTYINYILTYTWLLGEIFI